jgi:hypothetical protein
MTKIPWFLYRLLSLALGVFAFGQAINSHTNFDALAGLLCGAVAILFVLFVAMKNSVKSEQIFSLTSPCWPSRKYPQSYWFSTGTTIFLSAGANLIFRLDNPAAVSLYAGLLLLGLGMFSGAMVAHRQIRKKLSRQA